MPTRRFEQIALAQLLMIGCAVAFSACVLIELAQAQPGYVPPPTPLPPPVFNPSSPNIVPQPSYTPTTPSTPSTAPSTQVGPPEQGASAARTRNHHRSRFAGLTWPYYCGSSPCVRIHAEAFYGYAAPAYGVLGLAPVYTVASTLWWPGYYDYAPGQFGRGHPRYGGYWRRTGFHGD
jgi:hypothetical protein